MRSHIAENFRYPEIALKNDIEGRVFIMFNIDSNGHVVNTQSRGPDKSLEAAAERMIKLLPKMQPARQQGKTVKVSYGFPIALKKTLVP